MFSNERCGNVFLISCKFWGNVPKIRIVSIFGSVRRIIIKFRFRFKFSSVIKTPPPSTDLAEDLYFANTLLTPRYYNNDNNNNKKKKKHDGYGGGGGEPRDSSTNGIKAGSHNG